MSGNSTKGVQGPKRSSGKVYQNPHVGPILPRNSPAERQSRPARRPELHQKAIVPEDGVL